MRGKKVSTTPPNRSEGEAHPRNRFAKWRALSLSLVYVAFAVHIIHWRLAGKTLAPLELNEVMYTLELGVVTAGCLFMLCLVFGTMIFGRFFCSWTCHIMVLQDGCAWLFRKLGIQRKAVRSRVLLFIPPITALYMFVWPQLLRVWREGAFPTFHFATDADGWASFTTVNFWRNLPSVPITILTFVVCGVAIVYLLGSRTFCTYVCPYGAVFGLADRLAPGRIRVSDACKQCGKCTAVCTSGVRVHEEVKQFGMVVNNACLKDLDCVGVCPENALRYGFGRPSLGKSFRNNGRFGLPYDFSLAEDTLMGVVMLAVVLTLRGLYGRLPFLLSLASGAMIAFLAVVALRLPKSPNAKLAGFALKKRGHVQLAGRLFQGGFALLTLLIAHSAFIRYHEYTGLRALDRASVTSSPDERASAATYAVTALGTVERWGLLSNPRVERGLITVLAKLERFDDLSERAERFIERNPWDSGVRITVGRALLALNRPREARVHFQFVVDHWIDTDGIHQGDLVSAYAALGSLSAQLGDFSTAENELRQALVLDRSSVAAHAALGGVLAEMGRLDDAVTSLSQAVALNPAIERAQYNLGTILAHLGRFEEAIPHYRKALGANADDAEVNNNLGFALMRVGNLNEARATLERALTIDPDNADAHFNLGVILNGGGKQREATEHFQAAARLSPRYAELLRE